MGERWTCPPDRFPIMGPNYLRVDDIQLTVPLAFVEAHARQAVANHGQTVARLKERGGLGWSELCAVLEGRSWVRMPVDEAHERVMAILTKDRP